MYTNLNHEQIRDALIWMCDRARNQYNKHKRKTTHNPKYISLSKSVDPITNKHVIRWSHTKEPDMYINASLDGILTMWT
jgi:hypothetical protein